MGIKNQRLIYVDVWPSIAIDITINVTDAIAIRILIGSGELKNPTNQDTDGDGKCDINCDIDGDGWPDTNIDLDGDGKLFVIVDDAQL